MVLANAQSRCGAADALTVFATVLRMAIIFLALCFAMAGRVNGVGWMGNTADIPLGSHAKYMEGRLLFMWDTQMTMFRAALAPVHLCASESHHDPHSARA